MNVGERLKEIREGKELSQGDIEKKTGLLRCYVSRCENGHTVPNIETLQKWSKALGVSMAELFNFNGEEIQPLRISNKGVAEPKVSRTVERELHRIQSNYLRMTPRNRAILSALAHKLAG